MTPRDLLLAGLDRYPQHFVDCEAHCCLRCLANETICLCVEPESMPCTCGLAQWRAQVIALIEQAEREEAARYYAKAELGHR